MRVGVRLLAAAFITGLIGGLASAQTVAALPAKKDFVLHCADCHGVDGKGNGPAVQIIPGFKPVDLTRLSATHGGEFPRQEVSDIIDGRKRLPGHYDSETDMPLWGLMFQPEGREFSKESEAMVKARISALVDYIEGLQQK
jgi:hypothetical protein